MAVLQSLLLLEPSALTHKAIHFSLQKTPQTPKVVIHPHLKAESPPCAPFCGSILRWRRSTPLNRALNSVSCRAAAQEVDDASNSSNDKSNEDGGGFEVDKALERVLQSDESAKLLDGLAEKALSDEDSKALLKEFATAAKRVAKAKQELESIDEHEKDLADIVFKMVNKAVDEETKVASLMDQ